MAYILIDFLSSTTMPRVLYKNGRLFSIPDINWPFRNAETEAVHKMQPKITDLPFQSQVSYYYFSAFEAFSHCQHKVDFRGW